MTTTPTKRNESRSKQRAARRERKPLGTARQKLNVESKEEGYHYRWVLEERAGAAIQGGYEPVLQSGDEYNEESEEHTDSRSWQGVRSGTTDSGKPRMLYLMRIRSEWYDEDQATKQAELDVVENAIYHGITPDSPHDSTETYVPQDRSTGRSSITIDNQFKR